MPRRKTGDTNQDGETLANVSGSSGSLRKRDKWTGEGNSKLHLFRETLWMGTEASRRRYLRIHNREVKEEHERLLRRTVRIFE